MGYDRDLNTLKIGDDVFTDRRLAFAWQTPYKDGYWCIFGMKEEPTPYKTFPLVLLHEGEREDREKMYEGIIAGAKKYHAEWLLTDMGQDWENMSTHFGVWLNRMNVKGLRLVDMSDLSDIPTARPAIDSMARRKLLRISEGSVLWQQMAQIGPSDMYRSVEGVKAEDRYPAVYALSHIVMSYEYYPKKKRRREKDDLRPTEGYA